VKASPPSAPGTSGGGRGTPDGQLAAGQADDQEAVRAGDRPGLDVGIDLDQQLRPAAEGELQLAVVERACRPDDVAEQRGEGIRGMLAGFDIEPAARPVQMATVSISTCRPPEKLRTMAWPSRTYSSLCPASTVIGRARPGRRPASMPATMTGNMRTSIGSSDADRRTVAGSSIREP
jgi:hypothetical protein